MLRPIDAWFLQHDEPIRSCLQFLREYIQLRDDAVTETWKYGMPFYCYHGKMCCYLWVHKKYKQPYLGIVEGSQIQHSDLIQEKRTRMKILLLDPALDLPVIKINGIMKAVIAWYK
ncbi:MAG: DUF1801 domain-containing protein [Chitinophagaceae bacterium]